MGAQTFYSGALFTFVSHCLFEICKCLSGASLRHNELKAQSQKLFKLELGSWLQKFKHHAS